MLEFQDLGYLRVVLSGDVGGKSCSVAEVSCRDGEFVSHDLMSLLGAPSRLGHAAAGRFSVEAVGPDSVRIGVRLPFCSVRSGFSYEVGAVSYMLLEPSALVGCSSQSRPRDYAVGDTIPVMACTAGIPKTAEYGGSFAGFVRFGFAESVPEHFSFCYLCLSFRSKRFVR